MLKDSEVYVSVNVLSDGYIPGKNSILSIGAVAFSSDGKELSEFSINVKRSYESSPDALMMAAFKDKSRKDKYKLLRKNIISPRKSVNRFIDWLDSFNPRVPILIGYPASYDWSFINWYTYRYAGEMPFKHGAIDIKTLSFMFIDKGYSELRVGLFKDEWTNDIEIDFMGPLTTARNYGIIFFRMYRELISKIGASEILDESR